jgi:hypothetical protein
MPRKKKDIREVVPASTNADGSGLYQCPRCLEWVHGEEDDDLICDFCHEVFYAYTPVRLSEKAKVITIRELLQDT